MNKYILMCSVDGINVDYETELQTETEPDFWDCQTIAEANGCDFWSLLQL
jgi:hypothetical protein